MINTFNDALSHIYIICLIRESQYAIKIESSDIKYLNLDHKVSHNLSFL